MQCLAISSNAPRAPQRHLAEALASQADLIRRQREELKDKSRVIRLLTDSNVYQTSRVEALHTALFEREDRIERLHVKLAKLQHGSVLKKPETFSPFKFKSVFDSLSHHVSEEEAK